MSESPSEPKEIFNNPWVMNLVTSGVVVAIITVIGNIWVQNIKSGFEQQQADIQATQAAMQFSLEATQTAFNNNISDFNKELEARKQSFEEEINRLQANLQEQQVALAQSRFDEEQRARRAAVIDEWVPLLFSEDETERQTALAVIFAIYPNEAKTILESVKASQSEVGAFDPKSLFINAAIESAIQLDQDVGPWWIVVNVYDDYTSAFQGKMQAEQDGYIANIFFIDEKYDVILGRYPTKEDAQSAVISIRNKLSDSAYVINLNEKCPIQVDKTNFIQCLTPTPTPTPLPAVTPEPAAQ